MEWRDWRDKRIFVKLKSGDVYTGKVIDIDIHNDNLIFMTIIDKFGQKITFVVSEIIKIQQEREKDGKTRT